MSVVHSRDSIITSSNSRSRRFCLPCEGDCTFRRPSLAPCRRNKCPDFRLTQNHSFGKQIFLLLYFVLSSPFYLIVSINFLNLNAERSASAKKNRDAGEKQNKIEFPAGFIHRREWHVPLHHLHAYCAH